VVAPCAHWLDGRDLKPTLSLDALITVACAGRFALQPGRVAPELLPSGAQRPQVPPLRRAWHPDLPAHPTNPGRRADPTAWRSHTDHWSP